MPPKKTAPPTGDGGEAGGKFTWEGPNDNKLLLLTQGRYVKTDEHEKLSSAFPGTTVGSIRNRISALRVKQRNLYEELSWELPEGTAGHSAKKPKSTPAKRSADDDGEPETPTKKSRKKTTAKSSGSEGENGGVGVKEEQVEDES